MSTASDDNGEHSSHPLKALSARICRRLSLEKICRRCRKQRRGAAVVEFAIVAPIFLLFVFGMIEWGRMVMVQQILTNAAREGSRRASVEEITDLEARRATEAYLTSAGVTGATVTVTTIASVPPDYAESVNVAIKLPFSNASYLPVPYSFLKDTFGLDLSGLSLDSTSTMRREMTQ